MPDLEKSSGEGDKNAWDAYSGEQALLMPHVPERVKDKKKKKKIHHNYGL